jgi:hypothetical protein
MATGLVSWSQTAANNATADTNVNWAEGQAPSSVNDSGRGMMASLAKWRDDNAGSLVTAGTSTAYTLTTNQVFASLSAMTGQSLQVKFNAANGASPTLNVDGLGAKNIVIAGTTACPTGAIAVNTVVSLVYDGTSWVIVGGAFSPFASATALPFFQAAAPTGWTKSAANDNAAIRIVSGAGGGTGGSANFTTALGSRTIAQANLPNVSLSPNTATQSLVHASSGATPLTPNSGSGQLASAGAGAGVFNSSGFIAIDNHTVNFPTVALGGSGTAMDFAVKYVDMIICLKD